MPFEAGENWKGNANGRPKGSTGLKLTTLLREKLELIPKGKKQAYKELFIETLLDKALVQGDMNSYKLIMNYVDGLPTQKIENEVTLKEYNWGDYGETDNLQTEDMDKDLS